MAEPCVQLNLTVALPERSSARMRTSLPNILTVSDCTSRLMLAHAAAAGGLVANLIAGKKRSSVDAGQLPQVTLFGPQLTGAGLTETQARKAGRAIRTARSHLRTDGRVLSDGEAVGLINLVCDGEGGDLFEPQMVGAA